MVMSWIFTGMLFGSVLFAALSGHGGALSAAAVEGAQAGVTLALSITGAVCLWSGVGKLMEKIGVTASLSRLLSPVLGRIFPSTKKDARLAGSLSANVCANFLGLGNAATPMGIAAVRRLKDPEEPTLATDEMCRLIVLNTASIQFLPTNVAAVRSALGCASPFDILPAVWVSSLLSASLGVLAAWCLGKVWTR
ncbi:MAG: spore maturation protein A [Oscillospiraceae bacterium]|nr:spore maturation protein A [Oscillospiraceae bacterium]MDY5642555.1 spore maturation protein A [Candidatus Faecousia sp.]